MTTPTEGPDGRREDDGGTVTVYTRPGCPFSSGLMRGLEDAGLPYTLRDIWDDEEAAAFVRSVTGGDETVPTVEVGGTALVNPTPREVIATVAEESPELLPDGFEPAGPGRFERLILRLLGG